MGLRGGGGGGRLDAPADALFGRSTKLTLANSDVVLSGELSCAGFLGTGGAGFLDNADVGLLGPGLLRD